VGVLWSDTLDILRRPVVFLLGKDARDTASDLSEVLIKSFKVMTLTSSLARFSGKCPRFHLCLEVTSTSELSAIWTAGQ